MHYTCYGGKISFGWEFENTSLKILQWYEPSTKPEDWDDKSLIEKQQFVTSLQSGGKWGPGKKYNWSQYVRNAAAPLYLDGQLKQEIFSKTWEVTPDIACITYDVDNLFLQLDQVRAAFGSAGAKGFQVHIVFEAPNGSAEDRNYWNSRIAALYQLLNDYSSLKAYAKNSKHLVRGEFTGAAVESLGKLTRKLNAASSEGNNEIESQDENEAWVGKYKYHNVGLRREAYSTSNSLLGLEIRSGWKRDWGRFRTLIERVVYVLEHLDQTAHLKTNRPNAFADYYLEQHLEFKTADPLIPEMDRQFLESASEIIAKQIDRDTEEGKSTKLPYVYNVEESDDKTRIKKQGKIIYKRWLIALAPWEVHAAFSNDTAQCEAIKNARTLLLKNISDLRKFNQAANSKKRKPLSDLNTYFRQFFSTLSLYKYL